VTTTPEPAPSPVAPLPLDKVSDHAEHFGVKVAALGEDGDMGWVAFTHDRRRAIAALHRYIRVDLDSGPVREITTEEPRWWVVVDNCGHGDTCPHTPDEHDSVWHEDCTHFGLPPCQPDELGWIGTRCDGGTPGAVPVIEMQARY
jgi:hypothetical protein